MKLLYSAERATSSRRLGAVVFVMAVFLASMSAAQRAAPTGRTLVSSKFVTVRPVGLTGIGERKEDADEGDHLEERGDGTEAVPLKSVSVSSWEKRQDSRGVRSNVLFEPSLLLRCGPPLQLEVLHGTVSCGCIIK